MTKKITDLEGQLEAAFKRAVKQNCSNAAKARWNRKTDKERSAIMATVRAGKKT